MVKIHTSNTGGAGLIPGWGIKIPQAMWHSPKKKKKKNTLSKLGIENKFLNLKKPINEKPPTSIMFNGETVNA